jgi:hypothetical protein
LLSWWGFGREFRNSRRDDSDRGFGEDSESRQRSFGRRDEEQNGQSIEDCTLIVVYKYYLPIILPIIEDCTLIVVYKYYLPIILPIIEDCTLIVVDSDKRKNEVLSYYHCEYIFSC